MFLFCLHVVFEEPCTDLSPKGKVNPLPVYVRQYQTRVTPTRVVPPGLETSVGVGDKVSIDQIGAFAPSRIITNGCNFQDAYKGMRAYGL